jgi:hypothetical protein
MISRLKWEALLSLDFILFEPIIIIIAIIIIRSVLDNFNYKPYYKPIITDRTIHNNRPDIVTHYKAIKEAHSIDVAIPIVTAPSPRTSRSMEA